MKKRILSILLAVCMALTLMPGVSLTVKAASKVWDGSCDDSLTETARDGSPGTGYYLIDSAKKLAQVEYLSNNGNNFAGKTVLLTDDITLNSGNAGDWTDSPPKNLWRPIGDSYYNGSQYFYGTFDGQGHTISGLYLKDERLIRGLFGYIGVGGVICNVGLVNSYLEGMQTVGGFTGHNLGTIRNCWSSATVTTVSIPESGRSYSNFGGIAGGNGGTIKNCYNLGTVSDNGNPNASNFGGIAGQNQTASNAGTVINCYNAGTISGASRAGGIAGYAGTAYSTIQYSYSLSSPGIGTYSAAKIIGCGTFAGSTATDYIGLDQDSATGYTYTYTDNANGDGTTTTSLLSALNAWVNATASPDLFSWKTEGGYPVFDHFGVSTYGAFSVTYDYSSTAPTYASNTLTLGSGNYTVAMAEGITQTTTDIIVVSSGAAASITLNNVNIDISSKGYTCAFDMAGATVNLTLSGTNTLKSGIGVAGLRVPVGASLTITEQSAGSLEATAIDSSGHNPGAGIGGSHAESGGIVTIHGGTVTATGGADAGRGGAGIGGSCNSNTAQSGGTVTITGGTVTAKGGARGAGIGGGSNGRGGTGGTVTITGGTVIATGGSLGGAGIGGGSGGAADVVINGGSVKAVAGSSDVPSIGTGASSVYQGTLKNDSGTNVALYIFTLSGISSATAVTALSTTDPLGYYYGTTDMKTDTDGMLYLYLPAGKTGANITTAAAKTYKNDSFTGNTATLYYGYPVSGTVSAGTTGVGVSGLTVNLYSSTDTTFSTSVGSSTTDGSGAYAISGIPNGSYVARVEGVAGSYAASVSDTITVSDSGVSGANITLAALTTQSIAVKAGSHKIEYLVNDSLDVTNLEITVTRSDGSKYEMDVTPDMVSGFSSTAVTASQTLTVTFDGKTATYTVSVSRAHYEGDVAPAPTLVSRTDTQVTLGAVTVDGQTVEYGQNTSDITPNDWQDDTTFTGLDAGRTYYFFARFKQTATVEAGGVSAALTVATKAATPEASVVTVDYAEETLSFDHIYEVSGSADFNPDMIDSGDKFQPGKTYYVRVKAASGIPESEAASFWVEGRPEAPSDGVYSYDYKNERISFGDNYEVYTATSGGILVTSDVTTITPGGTLYIRVKSTDSAPASDWTTITVPERPETAGLSINTNKTDTTITVTEITGAEYSNDGGATWQSENLFTGLDADTDYNITIRYAADNAFASDSLDSVIVKTKSSAGDAPSGPSLNERTDHTITIDTVTGYQYAITTSDTAPTTWGVAETTDGTKTFSSLSAATRYYIWVRAAETDTATPSSASRISVYTTASVPSDEGYTIDYSAEIISYDDSIYEVMADTTALPLIIIENGGSITSNISDYGTAAQKIYVRVKAVEDGAPAGAWMEVTLPARPKTPAAAGSDETVDNKNDGSISDVTEAMEWKAAGGAYTAVTADQESDGISGLPDGIYYLRYMAVRGAGFKSAEQEITIAAGHAITVTFNSQNGSAVDTITGKAYGDSITAPADPTRSGFYFAGWCKEAACKNAWTFTLDTLTDNMTLFAKWSAIPAYTVTGKVVDDTANAVTGATVRIMQGATQFGTTGVTDTYGDFAIDKVPPGVYNLVITKGTKTATIKVEVSGNVAIGNAALPSGNANSILVVNGSGTPNVVVGGLDSEAGAQLLDSDDPDTDRVEITLTVEEKDASAAVNGSEVTGAVTAAGKQVGMILAIDVRKTVNGTEDTLYSQTNGLIEINIPLLAELQGKAAYSIYRYHGSGVDTITETQNDDLEQIVIDRTNWTITLYAKKFSTYAIGYTNPASGGGRDHTAATVPEREETAALPYYVENGKEIFIGFASDASGTMKYIAPEGTTVLFRENPKSFNDIAGHWAKENIDFVTERELFLGIGDGSFSPQSGMTRAMFATVIGRLYERSYGELLKKGDHNFTDVGSDSYYAAYIDWASENNIITGIGGGLFKPDREITRQEMAAILYRFAGFINVLPSAAEKKQLNYPDAAELPFWAAEAAMYCQQTGIITGRSGGNFVPQGTATRAEVAAILQRFIESSVK